MSDEHDVQPHPCQCGDCQQICDISPAEHREHHRQMREWLDVLHDVRGTFRRTAVALVLTGVVGILMLGVGTWFVKQIAHTQIQIQQQQSKK